MAILDNKKFLACCANGAGSSLMMEMAVKKALTKLGVNGATVRHCALSEGKSTAASYDIVFCARNFLNTFDGVESSGNTKVFGLKNIMSADEIEKTLRDAGLVD